MRECAYRFAGKVEEARVRQKIKISEGRDDGYRWFLEEVRPRTPVEERVYS